MNVRASWSGGRRFCFNAALNEVFMTMDRPKTPVSSSHKRIAGSLPVQVAQSAELLQGAGY